MKNELHKRIWSALLVLLMVMECLPIGAVRAELTEEPTLETAVIEASAETGAAAETTEAAPETTEATDAAEAEPVAEAADLCPYCEETVDENGTVIHGLGCNAQYAYDGTADVGKYVRLIPEVAEYGVEVAADPTTASEIYYYDEFGADTVMRITDWYWNPGNTGLWYQVELYSGAFPESTEDYTWPDPAWILQDYTDNSYEWDAVLEFYTPEIPENPDSSCPVCGKEDCSDIHFYCSICDSYNCTLPHPYCRICEAFDCTENHIWCGHCGSYDCGLQHEDIYAPAVEPVLPENPILNENKEVSILMEDGTEVSEMGLTVGMGRKTSISAWLAQGTADAYQWQIRCDKEKDLWVDIYGQKGQGILISPALFLSLLDREPAIRCALNMGEEKKFSDPIALNLTEQLAQGTYASDLDSGIVPLAEEEDNTVDIIVRYLFTDNTIAANPRVSNLPKDKAYAVQNPITVPTILGYTPTLDPLTVGNVTLTDGKLTMSFTAEEMNRDREIIIYYQAAKVKVVVEHYWQNVDNDLYVLHETQELQLTTGTEVGNVHKTYPGFDTLAYEKLIVAADGSTVVQINYDRRYYLITFELSGGYGVLPIYARYGTVLEDLPTPVKEGYIFLGWDRLNEDGTGDGIADPAPTGVEIGGAKYKAIWKAEDTVKVSVVFWGENANDEGYSYIQSGVAEAAPDTQFTYTANGRLLICGKESHTHGDTCERVMTCKTTEHTHSADCCNKVTTHTRHTTSCYNNVGDRNTDYWNTYDAPNNPVDGQIYRRGSRQRVISINGTWYLYSGTEASGTIMTPNASCPGVHTHGDGNCNCAQAAHTHTDTCYGYSCGLTEHNHINSCYQTGSGLSSSLWTFVKSDTITVKADGTSVINVYYDRTSFTMTFKEEGNNGKTLGTITDKWGASIRTRFETISTNNTFFWSENKNGGSPWTSFVDIMPEKNMTYYADPQTGSTTLTATYLGQTLNGGEEYEALYTVSFKGSSTITVSKEEFVPIKGYIFNEDKSSKIGNYYNGAKFYYDRASFKLEFNNGKEIVNTVTPLYEQPLTQYESFVPRSPEKYEPGSVVFAGWYMNPECSGQEYVLSTQKMPAENLILYAKWEPVMHDVTVYRFRNSDGTFPDGEDILVETMQIPHGQFVQEQYIPEDPEHGRYAFDGWFYIDEDGKEQAFSFRDIPVTQDMQIYAKWSSHVPYPYEIRFVLASDPTVAVADPITGSILQGSKTFEAKGGDALYEQYREGYFPHVKSHTVYIELDDENGEDVAVYIFKYTEVAKVPYTVRYLIVNDDGSTRPAFVATADGGYRPADDETETGQEYIKTVPENAKAVVTETYVAIDGYLPINNEYQKTLVVTPDGNNEIIFYYKADNKHALVQRNHYIQTLGGGWKEYQASTTTEDLNKIYSESAIEISHYTFSDQLTQKYNLEDKKDAYLNADLPGTVDFDPETNTVSGTLTSSGLQLNLYYVPNTYTYTVKYLELNTLIELEDTKEEQVLYGTLVTEDAVEIEKDLDGDGKFENFRLYEASQERQEVTILNDSTVITFYYVRCTQDLTVTKTLEDKNPGDSYAPDWNMSFNFRLILHANDFKHQDSYAYVLKQGDTVLEKDEYIGVTKEGESFPYLSFSLKHGQSITFIGLPTAVYTVEELSPPLGYYSTHSPGKDVTLTEDASVTVDVTNTYAPADLEISKTVVEVETGNLPEVQDFLFKVVYTGEETLPGSYTYTVSGTKDGQETRTVDVAGKQFNFTLKKGETAYFHNLPTGAYTVEEEDYAARGYKTSYTLGTGGEQTTGRTTNVELERGEVTRVHFTNEFPVGDLQIKKTVAKEFYGTAWTGDTFWFTVQRTDRDLTPGYKYKVSLGEDYPDTEAVVGEDKKLKISIPFDSDDAEALKAADTSVAHLLTIESLPAGTYVVNEAETPDYVQSDRDIEALAVPNNPVAEFTNTLKLPKGSLYLAKELIPAEGYEGDLDKDKVFTFTIKAVTAVPASATVDVSVNGGEPEARAMGAEGLTVTVKANQNVIISNLPVGTYRIIEATEPQYANKFAQAESPAGPWEPLVSSSIDGCLYTDVTVEKAERTHVLCTNVYPVNTAKLILHKKITNRQPQDPVPGDSFVFTVTLDKLTKDYITYQIFDESGTKVGADRTADVTDGSFTLSLSDGQYAVIAYLPVSSCTVTETGNAAYDTSYRVYLYGVDVPVPMPPDTTDMETEVSENGTSVTRELAAGTTELMIFENRRKATITYHSNYPTDLNLEAETAADEKIFDVDYTIEDAAIGETIFEAEGYVLESWNTEPGGTGTRYEIGQAYEENKDLTLYAQWIDKRIADGVKVYVGINMSYYMTENQDLYYTLPEEPAVIDLKGIRAHNHKDGNGGYYWEIDLTNWDDALAGEPTDFIRPEIMNPGVLVGNPNNPNENVVGVFDPDGEDTRALLYFTDEDYYGEKGIVAAWIAVRNDLKTKYPSDIYWDLLSDDPDDFEVIPYVIKYHGRNYSTTDLAWFIDMIIVPKARFSVKYEINLEDGYEATIPQDKNLYGENYFVNIKATDSTAVNQNDSRYVAKFKEWIATDENGKIIPIDTQHNRFTMPASNVILTAQWEYPVKYTVEYYKKDPISGDYVHQTKDDEEKVVYIGETAEYDDQKYSGFHFEKVEPTDLKIKEDNQVFKVYYDPNTLTISQTGLKEKESAMYRVQGNGIDMYVEIQGNKSVTIEQIPLGDYTVTELTDWTWKYDSDAESAASAKPVTVTPDGPNEVEFAFTTNNPDWLGGENAKNNKFASTPILQP